MWPVKSFTQDIFHEQSDILFKCIGDSSDGKILYSWILNVPSVLQFALQS